MIGNQFSLNSTHHHYPTTDLVILAGGQAQRMNGVNKLLQRFDHVVQLRKIEQAFAGKIQQLWINSHRDHAIYTQLVPHVRCFEDQQAGFLGPVMGMLSAWSHVQADYVLFIPCDVTYIPEKLLAQLHDSLGQDPHLDVVVVNMAGQALYPFCLMKRSAAAKLADCLAHGQRSIQGCFRKMHHKFTFFEKDALFYHSINSFDELQQYQQWCKLAG